MFVSNRQKFWEKRGGGKQPFINEKFHKYNFMTMYSVQDDFPKPKPNEKSILVDTGYEFIDYISVYNKIRDIAHEHRLKINNIIYFGIHGLQVNFYSQKDAAMFKLFWINE